MLKRVSAFVADNFTKRKSVNSKCNTAYLHDMIYRLCGYNATRREIHAIMVENGFSFYVLKGNNNYCYNISDKSKAFKMYDKWWFG